MSRQQIGTDGDDRLEGDDHGDVLEGLGGDDLMRGGDGKDVYDIYWSGDGDAAADPFVIQDRTVGKVDLSPIDAVTRARGSQDFILVSAFDGHPGELTIAYDATDGMTHVEGDLDGDGDAEFVLLITGDHADPNLLGL